MGCRFPDDPPEQRMPPLAEILPNLLALLGQVTGFPTWRIRPEDRVSLDDRRVREVSARLRMQYGRSPEPAFWADSPSVGQLADWLRQPTSLDELLLAPETHPYLQDHLVSGRPLLPLASVVDLLAWKQNLQPPWTMTCVRAERGLIVRNPALVRLRSTGGRLDLLEVRPGGREVVAFHATIGSPGPSPSSQPNLAGETIELPFPLEEFYARHTFHGPLLQGIERIDSCSTQRLVGWVRTSTPRQWSPLDPREGWHLDPLVLDSALQLALYWALGALGQAFLPKGMDECTWLRACAPEPVQVTLQYRGREEKDIFIDLTFHQHGQEIGWIRGLHGQQIDRWEPRKPPMIAPVHSRMEEFADLQAYVEREQFRTEGDPLGQHPSVREAACLAIQRWGTSAADCPLQDQLERAIAAFLGRADCLVAPSLEGIRTAVLHTLVGPGDLVLHDGGLPSSGAACGLAFAADDPDSLRNLLSRHRAHFRRVLICLSGEPPPAILELKKLYSALLMVEESRRPGSDCGDIAIGNLLDNCGGYVAGSRTLVGHLRSRGEREMLTPANAAAALAALEMMREQTQSQLP